MTDDFTLDGFNGVGDIDFDLDGFDLDWGDGGDAIRSDRYRRPRLRRATCDSFERALDFARSIDLEPGARYFAFVSGGFVFGDLVEALAREGKLTVRKMTVQTLSMSEENIDSIVNLRLMFPEFDDLSLLVSDYWYAHERGGLVPYMLEQFDGRFGRFRAAFARVHTKILTLETVRGNKLVMHGSANLRSSDNLEQVAIEQDDGLYDYVEAFTDGIIDEYDIVNHGAPRPRAVMAKRAFETGRKAADGKR